jgi:glycosyltransferase involved in cell wall biosynthesis
VPSEAIRVAMLISRFPPFVGGAERQAFNLSRALAADGAEVTVFTQRYKEDEPAEEVRDGVRVLRLGGRGDSLWASGRYVAETLAFLKRQPKGAFDVFHAHLLSSPAVLACLAQSLFHRPCVVKIACSGPFGDLAVSRKSLHGRLKAAFVLGRAARFVAVSTDVAGELMGAGVPPEKLVAIPNGVDAGHYRPAADAREKEALRRALDLPPGRWILFSGRLTAQKRPQILLDAFARVKDASPAAKLLFVGDGPEAEDLKRRAGPDGMGGRVFFRGACADVAPYYRASDVFVLPSDSEGLSNSLLEALSCGLVCLATRVGGACDVIEDGVDGMLFPPGDGAALASVLRGALEGPAQKMQEAARRKVLERFALGSVARRYLALYEEMLKAGHGGKERD